MVMFATRHANAQRASLHSCVDCVVRGACDLDAKISAGEQTGRPMWASEFDMLGSNEWLRCVMHMRDAHPRDPPADDPHYLLRDTNSPDGDPSRATAWIDKPCNGKRAITSLRTLGSMTEWRIPVSILEGKTLHSSRHDLPCVAYAGGDHERDRNEIGKWSGSLAQGATTITHEALVALRAARARREAKADPRVSAMPELYSAQTAEEIVPEIMERQVARLRALVDPRLEALPHSLSREGGIS